MKTFTKGIISILATTAIISGAVYAATWTGLATTAINQWDTIGQGWFQAVNDTVAKIGNLTEGKWCKVVSGKIDCTTIDNPSSGTDCTVPWAWNILHTQFTPSTTYHEGVILAIWTNGTQSIFITQCINGSIKTFSTSTSPDYLGN